MPLEDNWIAKSFRHHAEQTARFAQQALLCPAHKVATEIIISESIGRSTAAEPSSLWSMKELQTLEVLDDAHRQTGFLCQFENAEQGHAIGVLSNLSSFSRPQQNHIEVKENGKSHPQSVHSFGSTFWQKCFNGLEALDSLIVGSKVWSAPDISFRPSSLFFHSFTSCADSLSPLLNTWERRQRHQVGQVLRNLSCLGSIGARALTSGFTLHLFLLAVVDVVFFEFADCSSASSWP